MACSVPFDDPASLSEGNSGGTCPDERQIVMPYGREVGVCRAASGETWWGGRRCTGETVGVVMSRTIAS